MLTQWSPEWGSVSPEYPIVDGFTQIGFPFHFYIETSGRLADPKYASKFGYFPNYLAYDVIILLVAIIVFNIFAAKIMRKN